jgi:hypothetical protein
MAAGPREGGCVVRAAVADHDDIQLMRLEACEQGVQSAPDDPALIVCRDHD